MVPTTHAKVGHEVIISITANEVISRPTVSFESGGAAIANGGAITYANPSGNNWTAKYTAASGDIEGLITFSISYSDGAGNAGTGVTAVTDGTSVTFDKTAPTLSSLSLVSNNNPSTLANTDDSVTLTVVGSEVLQQPTVVFSSGGNVVADSSITYANPSGNTWTARYEPESGDTEGNITFSIDFDDLPNLLPS